MGASAEGQEIPGFHQAESGVRSETVDVLQSDLSQRGRSELLSRCPEAFQVA